jgi:hypothetical protein
VNYLNDQVGALSTKVTELYDRDITALRFATENIHRFDTNPTSVSAANQLSTPVKTIITSGQSTQVTEPSLQSNTGTSSLSWADRVAMFAAIRELLPHH